MEKAKKRKNSENEKEPVSKKKVIIAIFLICFAFLGSYLIYFILQISLRTQTPMVVVVSGSMEPTIHIGDLLFLEGKDAEDIKVGDKEDKDGDVIVFDARGLYSSAPDEPIVHRVIGRVKKDGKYYFETKGDNNNYIDQDKSSCVEGDYNRTWNECWVSEDRILGVMCGRIPYIGYVKIWLTETGLLIPLIIILSIPLIISIVLDIFREEEPQKKKETGELRKRVRDDKETKKIIEEKFTDKNEEKGALKLRKR